MILETFRFEDFKFCLNFTSLLHSFLFLETFRFEDFKFYFNFTSLFHSFLFFFYSFIIISHSFLDRTHLITEILLIIYYLIFDWQSCINFVYK